MRIIKNIIIATLIVFTSCKTAKYADLSNGLYADIETDKGDILLELYYKTVPITTANFVSLTEGTNPYVEQKFKDKPFFNGLTFHRVVPDFMIQGGDPRANGSGSAGYKFENEHPKNEDGSEMYVFDKPGVLAMANGGRDTNGSQFFITHVKYPSLNGDYSIFGQVLKGQNIVDSIAVGDKMNVINIIRVGKDAKKFDASSVFSNYFAEIEEKAKLKNERIAKLKKDFLANVERYKKEAQEFESGLKMYMLQKGTAIRPKRSTDIRINCAGYFTDGNLFYTTNKEIAEKYGKYSIQTEQAGYYNPLPSVYDETAQLIPGFREGILNMNYGDKVVLFIPSHLGYGSQRNGPIPPNSDLIFEVELVDESQND